MSSSKFDQKKGSIMEMLQYPENAEMRKRYNANLKKAREDATDMENWARNDFQSGRYLLQEQDPRSEV